MAQTNSALLLGGEAPVLLLPWFERIAVQGLADCLVADGFDHLEFHELVGQQAQAPACVAIRRLLTAQGDHPGLLPRIELAWSRPHAAHLALQRGLAALMILAPRALHGGHAHPERPGNGEVCPAALRQVLVSEEQGARPALGLGAAGASFDQLFQPEALLGLQRDAMLFGHRPSQQARGPWQPDCFISLNQLSLTHH
jgi:hypothetical protein